MKNMLYRVGICAIACAGALLVARPVAADPQPVVITRGEPVKIAFADDLTGFASAFGPNLANAARMAIEAHPTIRGFPVQLDVLDAPCGDPAADVATASAIAADGRYVGVLGQLCSYGFDEALPIYESSGAVVLTGSATDSLLSSFAPTVFNRTVVDDTDGFGAWYDAVSFLPSDLAWKQAYAAEFGTAPMPFADLYYDAMSLLIRDLQNVSTVDGGGRLVIDRSALAQSVRNTAKYQGVSCTITLDAATGNRINDLTTLSRCGE